MTGPAPITVNHPYGEEPNGERWDTAELQRDFSVEGFSAPYVVVTRKADGVRGTLEFVQSPAGRFYFGFTAVGQ